MTTQEFSIEFDILYNNLASNTAPPIDEYEKSVLLTKAQSDIVLELYSGRNNLGLSYENSEEIRVYLKALLCSKSDVTYTSTSLPGEYSVTMPEDVWLVTREEVGDIPVTAVTQDEYSRIKNNPFKKASSFRALRVSDKGDTCILVHRLSTDSGLPKYNIWGLKKPTPIILEGINDATLTIDGHDASSSLECILDSSIHRMILDRAVLYAKQAYIGGQTQE